MEDAQALGQILALRTMVARLMGYVALQQPEPETFLAEEFDELAMLRFNRGSQDAYALQVQTSMGETFNEVLRVAEASVRGRRSDPPTA